MVDQNVPFYLFKLHLIYLILIIDKKMPLQIFKSMQRIIYEHTQN